MMLVHTVWHICIHVCKWVRPVSAALCSQWTCSTSYKNHLWPHRSTNLGYPHSHSISYLNLNILIKMSTNMQWVVPESLFKLGLEEPLTQCELVQSHSYVSLYCYIWLHTGSLYNKMIIMSLKINYSIYVINVVSNGQFPLKFHSHIDLHCISTGIESIPFYICKVCPLMGL